MNKEFTEVIIKFNDGSYKGYNRNAFIKVFGIHLDKFLKKLMEEENGR